MTATRLDRTGHHHTRSCYWDHRRAGWTCPAPATELVAVTRDQWKECARPEVHEHQREPVGDEVVARWASDAARAPGDDPTV